MKILLFTLLLMTVACNEKKEAAAPESVSTESAPQGILPGDLPEEDCDDKAAKKVEITEESISLNNNTGCSLDEMDGLQK